MSSTETIDQPLTKKRRLNPRMSTSVLDVLVLEKKGSWKATILANVAIQIGEDPKVGLSATSFMTMTYIVRLLQQPSQSFLGELLDEIASCSPPERDWQPVFDAIFSLIIKEKLTPKNDASNLKYAAFQSWDREFVGDAQHALWNHIKRHFKADYQIYAYYTSIVQSSGMGKSRLVDELSKDHFVIPINIRGPGTTGYPPRDADVYSYLTELTRDPVEADYDKVYHRMAAFLQALFECTTETLQSDDLRDIHDLPATFRERMTELQTFDFPNNFRSEFYKNVITRAKALEQQQGSQLTVLEACSKLASSIQPEPGNRSFDGPTFLLVLDEAHTLTQPVIFRTNARIAPWSTFTVLTHALRLLNKAPCFSLFLSTTGTISQVIPYRAEVGFTHFIPPFTDLGFDHLAYKAAIDGTLDLDSVASIKHMVHLGRPLFGSMYDNEVGGTFMVFAAEKLLNDRWDLFDLTAHQVLACLSRRIPLDFHYTNYNVKSDRTQVEEHLRVCLKITPELDIMETTSSSEPFLSEAAYIIMKRKRFNVPMAMETVLRTFAVDLGDRGEFIAMLLLIVARDNTARGLSSKMSLCSFLTDSLWKSPQLKEAIQKDFPDAVLHFNHFIKVHTSAVLKTKRLLQLHTRGAAVQCANGQEAIDAAISFLPNDTNISYDNQGLILIRVQNDPSYTDKYDEAVFQPIDPRKLGILPSSDPAVPVIKVFFALAAKQPALHFKRFEASSEYNAVVYRIWCAGLSPEVFNDLGDHGGQEWVNLLKTVSPWQKVYKCPGSNVDTRRTQNPGVASELAHWNSWVEDCETAGFE